MAVITTTDLKRREVIISVHPMRGAILTVSVNGREVVNVALSVDDCRELTADFNRGWRTWIEEGK
jgi:hypothetical protein